MNLYLITFQSSLNRIESVYDCHKDLFVEIEKFFTLHLVPHIQRLQVFRQMPTGWLSSLRAG